MPPNPSRNLPLHAIPSILVHYFTASGCVAQLVPGSLSGSSSFSLRPYPIVLCLYFLIPGPTGSTGPSTRPISPFTVSRPYRYLISIQPYRSAPGQLRVFRRLSSIHASDCAKFRTLNPSSFLFFLSFSPPPWFLSLSSHPFILHQSWRFYPRPRRRPFL